MRATNPGISENPERVIGRHSVWLVLILLFISGKSLAVETFPAYCSDGIYWETDTLAPQNDTTYYSPLHAVYRPSWRKLIAPAIGVSYGVLSLVSEPVKTLNYSTRYEISEHVDRRVKWDNYTQYAPAVLVYGLNLAGVKGKHNLLDRTVIYATSQVMVASIVVPLKHIVREMRPDSSNRRSFPSGHTATAFSSAQFLFHEFRDENPGLALLGYPFAIFTGVYRALNNKHWVGDVVAGAGIGLLSTELSYWLYPKIRKWLHLERAEKQLMVYPVAGGGSAGVGLLYFF